jgi:hypothetical protein
MLTRHERWHTDGCASRQHWPTVFSMQHISQQKTSLSNMKKKTGLWKTRRVHICCRPRIHANAMYEEKVRKMAAPATAYQQDGRFGTSQFSALWSLTGQMTYELVLKIFPLRYNAIAAVRVHGSDQDGGKTYAVGEFRGKLQPAFSWNLISKTNPLLIHRTYPTTHSTPTRRTQGRLSEALSVIPQGKENLSTCAKSPSPEHEVSDRVSWLGFLWPQSDPPNKHHDGRPTSNLTTKPSHILSTSLDLNPTTRSQTPAVSVTDTVSKHKHHPKRVQ